MEFTPFPSFEPLKNNAMKQRSLFSFVSALAAGLILSGCSGDVLPSSTGQPYEILVVSPNNAWESTAGDTVRAIFGQEVEMTNQPEPIYDVLRVTPEAFNKPLSKHRNLLTLKIDPAADSAAMSARYDMYAQPQLVISVTAPTADSLASYLWRYHDELVSLYSIAERDRFMKRACQTTDTKINELVKQKFGFDICIPKGYTVRNEQPGFLWVSYEMALSSIGFIIYTYPADTTLWHNDLAVSIIAARNAAVAKVPGPVDGSYMTTSTAVPVEQEIFTAYGRQWNLVSGFWRVENDFMGGPFRNYTTYDLVNNRMIAIDGYVYSPTDKQRLGKRNFIRQIEAIFMTVRMEGTTPGVKAE